MTDNDRSQLSITLPVDGHHCLRLRCPRCDLDFKADGSGQLQDDLLAPSVGRIMREQGFDSGEPAKSVRTLTCPYCGHHDGAQSFMHDEYTQYVRRLLLREVVEPMISRMFNSTLGSLKSTKSVKFTTWSAPRRTRPLCGPDSCDMARVRCLSCDSLFKVVAGWRGEVNCVGCGSKLHPS